MTINTNYEQFEISLQTIEQELRPAVCEQRQTDRQTDLTRIIDDRTFVLVSDCG